MQNLSTALTIGRRRRGGGGGGGAPYSPTTMDNQGTAGLLKTSGWTGTPTAMTYSAWITPQDIAAAGTRWIMDFNTKFRMYFVSGGTNIAIQVWDSAGSFIYNRQGAHGMSNGTEYHLFAVVDLASGGDGSASVRVDGAEIISAAPNANIGTLQMGVNFGFNISRTGADPADTYTRDAMVFDSAVAYTDLYNSGTPPDPSTLGATPVMLVGGSSYGSTEANALSNAGSGADFSSKVGTFVDV